MIMISYARDPVKARKADIATGRLLPEAGWSKDISCSDDAEITLKGGVLTIFGDDIDWRVEAVRSVAVAIV